MYLRIVDVSSVSAAIAMVGWVGQLSAQPRCGADRWPVKIWADQDAAKVDTTPVPSTVQLLGSLPIPEEVYPENRRMAPHEMRVYRVRVIIERIETEDDGDWHLVLSDPAMPSARLIAEIPSPQCAATPALARRFAVVRDWLRRVPRRGAAVLTGIGFWDFIHAQRGGARNGFELHPVLVVVPISGRGRRTVLQLGKVRSKRPYNALSDPEPSLVRAFTG